MKEFIDLLKYNKYIKNIVNTILYQTDFNETKEDLSKAYLEILVKTSKEKFPQDLEFDLNDLYTNNIKYKKLVNYLLENVVLTFDIYKTKENKNFYHYRVKDYEKYPMYTKFLCNKNYIINNINKGRKIKNTEEYKKYKNKLNKYLETLNLPFISLYLICVIITLITFASNLALITKLFCIFIDIFILGIIGIHYKLLLSLSYYNFIEQFETMYRKLNGYGIYDIYDKDNTLININCKPDTFTNTDFISIR